jgi:hypothetical protein
MTHRAKSSGASFGKSTRRWRPAGILVCANHPDRLAAALHSSTTCFNNQSAARFSELLLSSMRALCDDPAAVSEIGIVTD